MEMSEQYKKVEKGLACCERRGYCEGHCPYYEPEKEALECTSELAHDALALISHLDERIKELSLMQVARAMTLEEIKNANRCKGCPFAKTIYTGPAVGYENGRQWTFTGCTHAPYRGKWVKEIEKCPKEPPKEET